MIRGIALGLVAVALFGYAVWTITQSPCLGVSDNGDFWRVMRPAGIHHLDPPPRFGRDVRCKFGTESASLSDLDSSSAMLAWTAKHMPWGLPVEPNRMDLRQMGLVYLLLVGGILAAATAIGLPGIICVCMLYVLVDPGYLLFFNSFYAEPTVMVAVVGLVVWFKRWGALSPLFWRLDRRRWILWTGTLLSLVILGATAKMMFMILPAVVTLTIAVPLVINGAISWLRAAVLGGALLLLSALIPYHFYLGSGPRFLWANNYHAVYGGILRVTSHPERHLRGLDIPEEFWDLPRRDVFSGKVAKNHPVHSALRGLSRLKLLGRYLGDPRASLTMAGYIQRSLSTVPTHPRDTRVRDQGRRLKKSTYDNRWQYSRLRGQLFGRFPSVLWFLIAGTVFWLSYSACRRHWDNLKAATLLLLVWALTQMVVVVLGDGVIGMKQHLVGTRFALDMMLILVVYDLTKAGLRRFRIMKSERQAIR